MKVSFVDVDVVYPLHATFSNAFWTEITPANMIQNGLK